MNEPIKPCPVCRLAWTPGGETCRRCRRLANIGILVESITESESWLMIPGGDFLDWDILDAVANILTDHAEERAAHRKELADAEREIRDTARDAYAEGLERAQGDDRG